MKDCFGSILSKLLQFYLDFLRILQFLNAKSGGCLRIGKAFLHDTITAPPPQGDCGSSGFNQFPSHL